MNKPAILLALLAGTFLPAPCLHAQTSSEQQQVLATEQARVDALDKSDIAALDRILADDLTYIHASGKVDTKSSFLDAIRTGQLHYISWTPTNLHVRLQGDMAVIDGEYDVHVSDLRMQPTPFSVNVFILTVYARRNGQWQQIAWQSTRDVAKSPLK